MLNSTFSSSSSSSSSYDRLMEMFDRLSLSEREFVSASLIAEFDRILTKTLSRKDENNNDYFDDDKDTLNYGNNESGYDGNASILSDCAATQELRAKSPLCSTGDAKSDAPSEKQIETNDSSIKMIVENKSAEDNLGTKSKITSLKSHSVPIYLPSGGAESPPPKSIRDDIPVLRFFIPNNYAYKSPAFARQDSFMSIGGSLDTSCLTRKSISNSNRDVVEQVKTKSNNNFAANQSSTSSESNSKVVKSGKSLSPKIINESFQNVSLSYRPLRRRICPAIAQRIRNLN